MSSYVMACPSSENEREDVCMYAYTCEAHVLAAQLKIVGAKRITFCLVVDHVGSVIPLDGILPSTCVTVAQSKRNPCISRSISHNPSSRLQWSGLSPRHKSLASKRSDPLDLDTGLQLFAASASFG